ncbi:MAG: LTA synthase family protein [Bacillota bacterium]|nr:LTA synthase family protein [Bacillota bacterium]
MSSKSGKKSKIISIILFVTITLLLFLGLLLITTANWYKTYYANVSFAQLLSVALSPLEGSDTGFMNGFFSQCLPLPLIVTVIWILFYAFRKKYEKFFRINGKVLFSSFIVSLCVFAYGGYQLVTNMKITSYLESQSKSSDIYENYYVDAKKVNIQFPEKKRNLIYIFLESMEVTYEGKETGGMTEIDYIPELTKLQEENLTFNGGDPNYNGYRVSSLASWTVGGIIGQTCGTPLNLDWDVKNNVTEGEFLPNATSVGDILKAGGYTNEFMCGSNIAFGGRENYLKQHGDYDFFDLGYAKENGYVSPDYGVWWGFEDKKLFSFAKSELDRLSKEDEPFNLTLLTCDTHFPDGYTCLDCQYNYDQPYSNVMGCSSKKVGEFVDWAKEQDWYENTTIVISGDHTTMDRYWFVDKDYPEYTRKAYYTIINPGATPVRNDARDICSYDLYPTTLASLGITFDSDRLGFGTNLFSEADTLIEELGFDSFEAQINQSSDYYTNYLFSGRDIAEELKDTEKAAWDTFGTGGETYTDLPQYFEGEYNFQTGVITYPNKKPSTGGETGGETGGGGTTGGETGGGEVIPPTPTPTPTPDTE